MGVRGELFSNRVILPNRTYFFNVKENRMGDLYLNIVESKNRDSGGFDRQSVILFADDLQEFLKGFDESLRVLEKAMREKRVSGKATAKHDENREERSRGSDRVRGADHSEKKRFSSGGEKSARGRSSERPERARGGERPERSRGEKSRERKSPERSPKGSKRVVVRKRD